MTGTGSGSLQLSQGYEVLPPKSGKAYPVPCDEWAFLKSKLAVVSTPPWILPALSFLFLGATLATLIALLVGGVAPGEAGKGLVIAWAVVVATGVIGVACLSLAVKQQNMQRTVVGEVIRQMELIEQRFEPNGA